MPTTLSRQGAHSHEPLRNDGSICRSAHRIAAATVTAILIALVAARLDADGQVRGKNVNVLGGPTYITFDPLEIMGDPWRNPTVEPNCAIDSSNPAVIVCTGVDYRWVDLPGGADGVHLDSWNMVAQSTDGGVTWTSRVHPGFANDPETGALKKYKFAADGIFRSLAAGGFVHVGLAANRGELATGAIYASTWFNLSHKEDDPEPVKNVTPGKAVEITTGNAGQFRDRPDATVGEPIPGQTCTHQIALKPNDGNPFTTDVITLTKPCTPIYVAYATFYSNGGKDNTRFHFSKSVDNGKSWTQPLKVTDGSGVGQGIQVVKFPGSNKIMLFWRRGATATQTDAIMVAVSQNGGDSFAKPSVFANICAADWDTTATRFRVRTVPSAIADKDLAYVVWSDRRNPITGACNPQGPARVWMATTTSGSAAGPFLVDTAYNGPAHQLFPSVAVANGRAHVAWLDFRNDASGIFEPTVDEQTIITKGDGNRHTADVFGAYGVAGPSPSFTTYQISKYVVGKPVLDEDGKQVPGDPNQLRQLQWNVVLARTVNKMRFPFIGDWLHSVAQYLRPIDPVESPGTWAVDTGVGMPPFARVFHNFWTDGRNVKLISDEYKLDANGNFLPRPYQPPDLQLALDACTNNPDPDCAPGGETMPPSSIYDPTQGRIVCTNDEATGTKNYDIYTSRTTEGLFAFAPWNNKSMLTPPDQNGQQKQVQRAFVVVVQHTSPAPSNGDANPPQPMHVKLKIANPTLPGGVASFKQFDANPSTPEMDAVDEERITLPPGSSAARTVFVNSSDARAAVRIDVVELESIGGGEKVDPRRTTVFLNPDRTAPENLKRPDNVDQTAADFDISRFEVHDIEFGDLQIQDISLDSFQNGATVQSQGPNWGLETPGYKSPGYKSPGYKSPGYKSPGYKSPGYKSPGYKSPGYKSEGMESPGYKSEGWESTAVSDTDVQSGSYRHIRRALTNVGNTRSSYTVRALVNGPTSDYKFQLVAYKLYTTVPTDGCSPDLVANEQVVLNISNYQPTPANFNSPPPEDVQNATVEIGPGETLYTDLVVFDPSDRIPTIAPATVLFKAIPHAVNTKDAEDGETTSDAVFSDALTILVSPAPATGTAGSSYGFTPEAAGGVGTRSWTIVGGTLPGGLNGPTNFNTATGAISGTPTQAGTFVFTLNVQDAADPPNSDTQTFSMTINPGPAVALAFLQQPTNEIVGQAFSPAPSVRIVDAYGNTRTSDNGTPITLAFLANPGNASLLGTKTQDAVAGVATFAGVRVTRSDDNYRLKATSGSLTQADSQDFDINLAVGTDLATALSSPANGLAYRAGTNDLLVTEFGASKVSKVSASSGAVTLFTDVTTPDELAVHPAGDVFVKTHSGGPIHRFTSTGVSLGSFPAPGASPTGIAFDASGNFYVADTTTGRIWKYAAGTDFTLGNPPHAVFAEGFPSIEGMAVSPSGALFVAAHVEGKIYKVTPGGSTESSHAVWASNLTTPLNVAFDPVTGDMFASSTNTLVRIFGQGDHTAFATGFTNSPGAGAYALTFDSSGNLYADDFAAGVIRKFAIQP